MYQTIKKIASIFSRIRGKILRPIAVDRGFKNALLTCFARCDRRRVASKSIASTSSPLVACLDKSACDVMRHNCETPCYQGLECTSHRLQTLTIEGRYATLRVTGWGVHANGSKRSGTCYRVCSTGESVRFEDGLPHKLNLGQAVPDRSTRR